MVVVVSVLVVVADVVVVSADAALVAFVVTAVKLDALDSSDEPANIVVSQSFSRVYVAPVANACFR